MADQGQSRDLLWSSDIRLELLGPVRLASSAGDDLTPRARKTRALIAVLVLSKGPVSRARLTELLWGDRGEEQAKASLRQALYELRPFTDRGYLSADRECVSLSPKKLASDVNSILRLSEEREGTALATALEQIASPILGSLDDVTPELDDWLRDERARISAEIVAKSAEVAESCLSAGETQVARRIADQLERLDPLDERVAQLGTRADLATGDRSAAARRQSRFRERLKNELGVEPSDTTSALLGDTKIAAAGRESSDRPRKAVAARAKNTNRRTLAAIGGLLLLIALAAAYALLRSPAVSATPTVAVLPFDDFGQKNEDYFASGVSDEILNLLAHDRAMKVLGRVSAEQLAGGPNSLRTARELGVTYLLDGSVRTSGNRILVIARLTRVFDGAQVWSERYERKAGDIFAVQGNIASAVASRVAQSFAAARPQGTAPEVYDRYLAARQLVRERRDVTLGEAERLLREAIAIDPQYAPAFAELAQVIMLRAEHPTSYGTLPLARARAEAEPFARRAIALDPNLGDGYAAVGFLYLSDKRSEPFYRKAVELSPQRAEFHRWHAQSLWDDHRVDEGIAEYRRAVDIDPLWGLSYDHLIGALYMVGRQSEADALFRRFLHLSTDTRAKLQLEQSLSGLVGQAATRLKLSRQLYEAFPDERQSRLGLATALAQLGERSEAAKLMKDDPIASAVLRSDWAALARAVPRLGEDYWSQAGYWNTAALLIDSGHADVLVRMYDQILPKVDAGAINRLDLPRCEIAIALRQAGRVGEANALLRQFQADGNSLPNRGMFGEERAIDATIVAALTGKKNEALNGLDAWLRRRPIDVAHTPAMSLRYDPSYALLRGDRRFGQIDERLRGAVNAERTKAGLRPISSEAWISDPTTLLTKN